MIRLILKGWRIHAYLDIIELLRNRSTFLTYAFSELVLVSASVTGMILLASKFGGIGQWSRPEIFFMLGFALTVDSLLEMFFGYNIRYISRRIGRGQLDHLIIQPRPMWVALLTEGFGPYSCLLRVLPGLGLLQWSIAHRPFEVSLVWIGWMIVNVFGSIGVILGFAFAVGSLAFWAPREAEEISSPIGLIFVQLQVFPLDGLGSMTYGLLTVLPVGFAAWFPSRALLATPLSITSLIVTPIAGLIFVGIGIALFQHGMRHYQLSGSQRYVDYGHRR